MRRYLRLLPLACAAGVVAACGVSPNPRFQAIDAYVAAHNRYQPDSAVAYFTQDAKFVLEGRDSAVGRANIQRVEEANAALHDQLTPMDYVESGDTVFVHTMGERNDWFGGLGIDQVFHKNGTAFIFKGNQIAEVRVKPFNAATQATLDSARVAFTSWAHQNRPTQLASAMPDGQMGRTPDALNDLRLLLHEWSLHRAATTSTAD